MLLKDKTSEVHISKYLYFIYLQEEIFKKFETAFEGEGKIMQKRIKNGDLKFAVQPPKPVAKVQPEDVHSEQVPLTTTNSDEVPRTQVNSIEENEAVKEFSKV